MKKRRLLAILISGAIALSLFACSSNGTESSGNVQDIPPKPAESEPVEPAPSEKAEAPAPDAGWTTEQKNAMDSALTYLSFSAFSHDGLVDQLEYEKYSHESAVWAADNCGADWNEQALWAAKGYLDSSAFSYTGLIEQLEYEKYTEEQATYGADNCGADWNEQAAASAKRYLDISSFSRDSLIDQLEYEGFTYEQAVYGVEQNGY